MSFSASQRNINELLSRNSIYNIPKNQRKYVWGENEWNELFEDLFLIDQTAAYNHFLGSVVLAREKQNNQFSVIDGQQRLTTICILILSIINHLYGIGENKIADSYKNTFLRGNNDGEDYYKIERNDSQLFLLVQLVDLLDKHLTVDQIEEQFRKMFSAGDKYNEKLLNCFVWYYNKLGDNISKTPKKKDYLIQLKDKLVNCEIIEIIVDKDVDGYRVFETLNARGIPLEQHELLKNYLYSYLRTKSKIQKLDHQWERIIQNVTFNSTDFFSSFISHYCSHLYGKTSKNEEFKKIRNNTKKTEAEQLLNSLVDNSLFYSFFLEPYKLKGTRFENDKIIISLQYFKDLKIRQVRPLLMSLFEKCNCNEISLDELQKCIEILEIFYFIYSTVLKNTSNIIDNSILSLSKRIHNSSEKHFVQIIKDELSKYVTEIEKAKESFRYLGYSNKNKKFKNSSNKKTINYIFAKFEHYYDVNNELEPKISSIEHIMNDDVENDSVCYIGNLLPLSSKLNNKISSKSFCDKLLYYKKSKLLSVEAFLDKYQERREWTELDIEERGKTLSNIALDNIWVF